MFLFKIPQDPLHLTINKIRRCFMYNNQYFQLDIYKEPCHPRFGHSHVIQRIGNVIGKNFYFCAAFYKKVKLLNHNSGFRRKSDVIKKIF